ncbi:MAG: LysE family translocator [Desulfovibrio sp.]
MTLSAALAFAGAMFLFALTPGAGIFAIIARSLSKGWGTAALMGIGMVLGDFTYMVLSMTGLAMLASQMGELFVVVKLIGGLWLIWMGIQAVRAEPTPFSEKPAGNPKEAGVKVFCAGLFVSLSNPKVILFYLGFLPTFVDLQCITLQDGATLVGIMVVVLTTVLLGYALLAARARRLFTTRRSVSVLNKVSGSIMAGAGVVVATK